MVSCFPSYQAAVSPSVSLAREGESIRPADDDVPGRTSLCLRTAGADALAALVDRIREGLQCRHALAHFLEQRVTLRARSLGRESLRSPVAAGGNHRGGRQKRERLLRNQHRRLLPVGDRRPSRRSRNIVTAGVNRRGSPRNPRFRTRSNDLRHVPCRAWLFGRAFVPSARLIASPRKTSQGNRRAGSPTSTVRPSAAVRRDRYFSNRTLSTITMPSLIASH